MSIDKLNCKNCKNKNTINCKCELEFTKEGTVFDHTIAVLESLDDNANFEIQIAALFHDVGKNEKTFKNREGKYSFIGHEKVGINITKNRLKKLKFDNNSINFICNLISHHMDIHGLAKVTDKAVRRFLRECNEFMEDLFLLVDADCLGTYYLDKNTYEVLNMSTHEAIKNRAREINEEMKKLTEKPFRYFDGNELIKIFKLDGPSKEVGKLIAIQNKIIDEYGFYLDKEKVIKLIKGRYNNV
jgi:putative nucleotidyltransferase with HDIG domain